MMVIAVVSHTVEYGTTHTDSYRGDTELSRARCAPSPLIANLSEGKEFPLYRKGRRKHCLQAWETAQASLMKKGRVHIFEPLIFCLDREKNIFYCYFQRSAMKGFLSHLTSNTHRQAVSPKFPALGLQFHFQHVTASSHR